MSLLKSTKLPCAFDSLEGLMLGKGVTYAEEQFRKVIKAVFGNECTIVQREIIVPKKVCRPEVLHDPSGVVMRSDLLEVIASKSWGDLTVSQKLKIYKVMHDQYRVLQNDDFEVRTVFFRATIRLGEDQKSPTVSVVARVVAYAMSGWWNMSTVRMWHRKDKDEAFTGNEYQPDGPVVHRYDLSGPPPKFLL